MRIQHAGYIIINNKNNAYIFIMPYKCRAEHVITIAMHIIFIMPHRGQAMHVKIITMHRLFYYKYISDVHRLTG